VFDGLQYATRVLNETVRLNRERTLSDANAFAFEDPSEDPETICSDAPADAGRTGAALSPVPEREAANRANVARVKADADSAVIGRPIAKKRSVPRGQAPDPKKSDPRESRSKKPVKKATKPSPYAQSASVAGAAGKPRSAALRRRLEKIRA
jgi:hypothetical protein